jgi:hypothetical protein
MNAEFKVKCLRFKVATHCAALVLAFSAGAATTNSVPGTNAAVATANTTSATNTTTNTNAISGTDFSSFKIITERNIFSANRSGRVSSGGPNRKVTKVDSFTLVGTVDYSKGVFAIFDGSSSSYRKTVKMGDSFAGFKIKDVDLDHVTIGTTNGADTVLHVGTQMRRVDDGEWAIGTGPAPQIAKTSAPGDDSEGPKAADSDSENSKEPAPSADTSDVLKKLMQKRKAEVKNESE